MFVNHINSQEKQEMEDMPLFTLDEFKESDKDHDHLDLVNFI